MTPKIKITDRDLFGKNAAEDEEESLFESYKFERPEIERLISRNEGDSLAIVSAFRGEGKSALLRMAIQQLDKQGTVFLSRVTSTNLTHEKNSDDPAVHTKLWKASIYNYVAKKVGEKINFAWNDDSMALVELAQSGGFRNKSWLIGIYDRIKLPKELLLPEQKPTTNFDDIDARVRRWTESGESFWLFIDDIDANFKDSKGSRAKLMGFFQALREIRNEAPGIRIRATVRPNIWAILRLAFPDSGKLSDYIFDLKWTEIEIRNLLARRIEAYLKRKGESFSPNPNNLIAFCFQDPMHWGGKNQTRPPHVVLNTLSRSRPRWLIEIAKEAAKKAEQDHSEKINLSHINQVMIAVGQERKNDLCSEYEAQCKDINTIIEIFHKQEEEFTTKGLYELIEKKLLAFHKPEIMGAGGTGITPAVVTKLLFEIGFLTAKEKNEGENGYNHYSFSDKPTLINAQGLIPETIYWEIHPIFRQALGIRAEDGSYIKHRPR